MLTLIFLFLVLVGLSVFLTIFNTIFNGKVIAGGVIGYFLAKWLNKREDNK
nr:MAG TPA: Protein of unknown function (DUF1043) [Caudoviricetes sp.]